MNVTVNSRDMIEERKELEQRVISNPYVCFDCGEKYMREDQKKQDNICTVHDGICVCCFGYKGVAHIRNFNWLRELKTDK